MLTERRQQILAALIHEYVAHALPVASKALVESYPLGVSSATVRNDLSALEDDGYIQQPHTSAGRIPTDHGYRNFVDDFLARADLEEGDASLAEAMRSLRAGTGELDELLERTSALLVRLTACLSIVLPARAEELSMRSIGLSVLMQQPEFKSSLVLVPLLRMIEDNSLLCYINEAAGRRGPAVRIGHENEGDALDNVSVVAARFGAGEDSGLVAVIGPTRMDYEKVIRAVQAARLSLGEI